MTDFEAGLMIPVNPDYDANTAPQDQELDFANPVALSNHLLVLANAMLHVAGAKVHAMRRRAKARLELRTLQGVQSRLVRQLLKDAPLSSVESKNLTTTASAVAVRVEADAATAELFAENELRIEQLENEVEKETDVVEQGGTYVWVADKMMDGIKTNLAFYKDERRKVYGQ